MKPIRFRNSITIKDKGDWELIGSDVIDDFLWDFTERPGLTREPDEDDLYDFDGAVQYMYTQKGMMLYDRMVERLNKLGHKFFPDEEFHYCSGRMIFP